MDRFELRQKAAGLPLVPGVYIMRDSSGTIIYVGKARALKNRVSQYFHESAAHSPKVTKMVEHVYDFEVIVADSEFDALVLENILIKKHMPKYNIKLKDDKSYPFIKLDPTEEYPRFTFTTKRENDGAHYYGPYGSHSMAHHVINTLSETLRLPSCSKHFPRDFGKGRPCLNAQMDRCIGLCRGNISRKDYLSLIQQGELMLRGDYTTLLANLEKEMEAAAEAMAFEKAATIRDRIYAVRRLSSQQIIVQDNIKDADAVAYISDDAGGVLVLLSLRGGNVTGKFTVFTPDSSAADSTELITDFILQYYTQGNDIPPFLFLSEEIEDREDLARLLSDEAGRRVQILLPKRGAKHAIVDMARSNARDELLRANASEQKKTKTAAALAELLALEVPPARIEAFDISNTGSDNIVASMVVFENGKPRKSDYRKFKIQNKETQDDYASIHEVITRRITDLQEGKTGFAAKPDLILIDGGLGQLHEALDAMNECGLILPVFGMKKDDRHRTHSLVTPEGEEIGLAAIPSVFAFIGTIQEEAHRFAIGYHRSLRDKKSIKTELDEIPGIGKTRRTALLTKFRSINGVKKTSLMDLAEVIGKSSATKVYEYFHRKDDIT
ncbi:MAG: excinuclease ABC subunit UvrC [Clostridia bacterium]|nr:excinuclease ABC subunit UvrC [Clostridia bacterium]